MVTAIVIPVICLYFYWLTRNEMKEQDVKWLAASHVRQEAILTGEIKSVVQEKQRFYYNRYIFIQTIKLQTANKVISVQKVTPITKNVKIDSFTVGDVITVSGTWEGSKFLFSHYEIKKR
jgi:hypothetical protein